MNWNELLLNALDVLHAKMYCMLAFTVDWRVTTHNKHLILLDEIRRKINLCYNRESITWIYIPDYPSVFFDLNI
jgi:hypothetical protein